MPAAGLSHGFWSSRCGWRTECAFLSSSQGMLTLFIWGHTLRTTHLGPSLPHQTHFACLGPAQRLSFLAEITTLSLLIDLTFLKHPPIYNWNVLPENKIWCLKISHWLIIFEDTTQTPSCPGPFVTWPSLAGSYYIHSPATHISFPQAFPTVAYL